MNLVWFMADVHIPNGPVLQQPHRAPCGDNFTLLLDTVNYIMHCSAVSCYGYGLFPSTRARFFGFLFIKLTPG